MRRLQRSVSLFFFFFLKQRPDAHLRPESTSTNVIITRPSIALSNGAKKDFGTWEIGREANEQDAESCDH